MSASTFIPGLIVLGLGLLFGFVAAVRLARKASAAKAQKVADLGLAVQDLEETYADSMDRLLYAERDGLAAGDREALEIAAARSLRDLERLKGQLKTQGGQPRKAVVSSPQAGDRLASGSFIGRHPLLSGAALGGGIASLVAVLLFWAYRDAKPRDDMNQPASPQAAGPSAPGQGAPGQGQIPAAVEAQLAALQAQIEANPQDLMPRKQLALLLLDQGLLFEAFQAAGAVLEIDPMDPDGLYAQGIVRFSMGQDDQAVESLEAVVMNFPEHGRAWLVLGLAQVRSGDRARAAEAWRTAAKSAGETSGQFLELASLAESDRSAEEIFASLGVAAGPMGNQSGQPAGASRPAAAPPSSGAGDQPFRVSLRLDPAASVPPGATLFVFLKGSEEGPPAAVKRIDGPRFPMELGLGPQDSMLGRPLPASGTLVARLDSDGSASTQSEGDLEAASPISAGQAVLLTLSKSP